MPPKKKTKISESSEEIFHDSKIIESNDGARSKNSFTVISWNVDGLNACIKKGGMRILEQYSPEILCLQETKCSEKNLQKVSAFEKYNCTWLSGIKVGYAGVGILCKQKPLKISFGMEVSEFDQDGRIITAEFDEFSLVNVYVPNSGRGLKNLNQRLKWNEAFKKYLSRLNAIKPLIICGDLNVAHETIDIANPKSNVKNAGFTPEERQDFTGLLKEGFVDTFRYLHPEQAGAYTFWSYMHNSRAKNIGWRLDYFLVSEKLLNKVNESYMMSDIVGSDHCPIFLSLC